MELIINSIEYISIIVGVVLMIKVTNHQLKLYQQGHYHLANITKILKSYYLKKSSLFLIPLILVIYFLDKWYIQLIYSIYLSLFIYYLIKQKSIIKLKITTRIKRLYVVILIIKVLVGSMLLYLLSLPQLMSAMVIIILTSPIWVFISFIITIPIEQLISKYYQNSAKKKLKEYNAKVIGITGSYGKTSTKMMLYSFLKDKYITFATEKSFNTMNGISKNINENLNISDGYLIAELGASHVNDIKKLVKLVNPKYGIVTEVGPQHLNTFKNIQNILKEKMLLIESLPDDGIGIINGDNELIRNYKVKSKCKLLTFGIDKFSDYQAVDINMNVKGISFHIKYNNQLVFVESKLFGKHNIYNILAAFALAIELKVSVKDILFQIRQLEPVKNRLSVSEVQGYTIIDDAFNSNKIGFENALDVLKLYDKPKVLITPGIVEAGSIEEKINYDLSKKISTVCDFVVLVKTKSSLYIKQGLFDLLYTNVIVVDSFFEAMKMAEEKYREAVILIENDVTDIYKI